MDVVVTPADEGRAWTLTDLLGRSVGRVTKGPGNRFYIEPHERARSLMAKVILGPHVSLDAALGEIEKHTNLVCHCTSGQT